MPVPRGQHHGFRKHRPGTGQDSAALPEGGDTLWTPRYGKTDGHQREGRMPVSQFHNIPSCHLDGYRKQFRVQPNGPAS